MPRRERSWMTRSSPSNAKRPLMRTSSSFSSRDLAMTSLLRDEQHGSREELTDAKGAHHRPRRERALALREGDAQQPAEHVVTRGDENGLGHHAPTGEQPERK